MLKGGPIATIFKIFQDFSRFRFSHLSYVLLHLTSLPLDAINEVLLRGLKQGGGPVSCCVITGYGALFCIIERSSCVIRG